MKKTVSIILPIYKIKSEYIEKCVLSLINQPISDIEIILVDDGTPDDGGIMCDNLSKKFSNCKVIHQTNQGVSMARNNGIKHATGDWIMFVDPDDYIEPQLIETLLKNCNNKVDIVCCGCKVLKEDETIINDLFFDTNKTFITLNEKKELYKQLMIPSYGRKGKVYTAIGVPWGKLYRKDFLKKYRLEFDAELRRMQDNIFNMNAFNDAREIIYINKPFYVYRYEHINKYQNKYNPNNLKNHLNIISKRYEFLKKNKLLNDNDLYHTFLQESFIEIKAIIRYGPLHKKYPKTFKESICDLENIISLEIINKILLEIQQKHISMSLKDFMIYQLIKNKKWRILKAMWLLKK